MDAAMLSELHLPPEVVSEVNKRRRERYLKELHNFKHLAKKEPQQQQQQKEEENAVLLSAANVHMPNISTSDSYGNEGNNEQQLLHNQQLLSSSELDEQRLNQQLLLRELAGLTDSLKEGILRVNSQVKEQNMELDAIATYASKNFSELESQREKMGTKEKEMKRGVFESAYTVLWVLALLVVTYAAIRLAPNPRRG